MTLLFHLETTEHFDFSCEEVARQVISAALDHEHFPYEAEVSLTLVDNEAIREINREFRQIDAPTDVLSFPMIDYRRREISRLWRRRRMCSIPKAGRRFWAIS